MKPMVYQPERKIEVLHDGVYEGYHYAILSYGTHPCAYVEIPKDHPYYKYNTDKIEDIISCHWGITYCHNFKSNHKDASAHIYEVFGKSKVIGWDYAHCYDYSGTYIKRPSVYFDSLKKWTTEEIYEEVIEVIKQLKGAIE